jgi:hypothetical protein
MLRLMLFPLAENVTARGPVTIVEPSLKVFAVAPLTMVTVTTKPHVVSGNGGDAPAGSKSGRAAFAAAVRTVAAISTARTNDFRSSRLLSGDPKRSEARFQGPRRRICTGPRDSSL